MQENLNLVQKLAKIRAMSDAVVKSKRGYNYSYEDITEILANVTSGMKRYGVTLIPTIIPGTSEVSQNVVRKTKVDKAGKPYESVTTEMLYSADMLFRWINDENPNETIEVPWFVTGSQEDPSQAFGSGLTYCTRYFLTSYFQIARADSDVDAYPVVSNWYIGRHQSRIQTEYREVLEQTDCAEIESIRKRAVAYNNTITPGAAEEAYSQASIRLAAEDYVNQLNVSGSGIMGYVEIPKIGADLPIYHGTGGDSLDRGTGHLLGSSLPVGGGSTHTIITGHSGMASQKMFTDLEQLREGDIFYLHVLDETLAYEVRAIHTVLPHDTTYLGIEPGEDLCTLVTCTPTGVNTHRLLVQGSRIPYVPTEETEASAVPHEENTDSHWEKQYWLGVRLGLAAMVFLTLVAGAVLYIRRNRGRAVHRKGGRYVRK